jgi:hypothetical protein
LYLLGSCTNDPKVDQTGAVRILAQLLQGAAQNERVNP